MTLGRVEPVPPDGAVPVIAVIGGGFSGAALTMQLARRSGRPIAVAMFDEALAIGRGVAYGVPGSHLLLNVPAGKLGWDPEEPEGFHRWLVSEGRFAEESAFLPREWFGDYIESSLSTVLCESLDAVQFTHIRDRVVSVRGQRSGVAIRTRGGGVTLADQVVLAPGNGPSRLPDALGACVGSDRFLADPWDMDRLGALCQFRRILLVGTGLTMCDIAVSLAHRGFDGEMVAVSRHGLTPRVHGPSEPAAHAAWATSLTGTRATRLLRAIRARAAEGDWRFVIDSLRPHLPRLWDSLSPSERTRFVSRLATYWDVHRHRCPRETDAALQVLREQGRLRVVAGRIARARPRRRSMEVTLRGTAAFDVDAIVLCTGPEPDPRRWHDPLMDELFADGLVTPDRIGLGIDTDEIGFAANHAGIASSWLSTIGPLRRGRLWESTAVPELRCHAADLATVLVDRLNDRDPQPFRHTHQEIKA